MEQSARRRPAAVWKERNLWMRFQTLPHLLLLRQLLILKQISTTRIPSLPSPRDFHPPYITGRSQQDVPRAVNRHQQRHQQALQQQQNTQTKTKSQVFVLTPLQSNPLICHLQMQANLMRATRHGLAHHKRSPLLPAPHQPHVTRRAQRVAGQMPSCLHNTRAIVLADFASPPPRPLPPTATLHTT